MLLRCDTYAFISSFKFKQRDYAIFHKLRCYGSTNQRWEFVSAYGKVLFNLNHAKFVRTPFCLNREDIVDAFLIYTHVDFVCLDLSYFGYCGAQVILERVTSYTCKDVDKTVVTNFSK